MASIYSARPSLWLLVSFFTALFTLSQAAVPADPASVTYYNPGNTPDRLSNITLSLNVPQNSTDTLYFHLSAPAGPGWFGFGFGNQMAGSLMFVTYASASGKNVTVSPRIAQGTFLPPHTNAVTATLLAGSGLINDVFVANVVCKGCRSWNGGSIDITNEKQNMFFALGPNDNIQSDDLNYAINQHSYHEDFNLNLKQATGLAGVPTLNNSSSTTDTGTGGTFSGGRDQGPPFTNGVIAFHALLLIVAFLIIFPGGYLFLRLFEKVWLHWTIQSIGAFFVLVGVGAGIAASKRQGIHPNIDAPHQIIGLIVLVLIFSTYALGLASHMIFKRTGSPAKIMIGHRVLGPASISFGLVNVCVGFNFAGHRGPIIGFIILTVIMIAAVSALVFWKRRRQMRKQAMNTPAAMNFRQAQMGGEAGYQQNIPLESYGDRPAQYR